ncbi:MAG: DsbE family thiol:disulfide interchange protein [Proteobacteria bacterium]|nr:DsbE family thiol:disulfide interchange protein [Pseudomonadota bacterium]
MVALFLGWSLRRDPHVSPNALVGRPVPAVTVTGLASGQDQPLNGAIRGPALLNVFASWCAPCRVEHPRLMELKARGVRIVGLAWKDDPAKTQGLLDELGNPYDLVLTDQPDRAGIELGLSGVPETYVIDSHGVVVDKLSAPITPEDEEALYRRLKSVR